MHRLAATPGGWTPDTDGVIFVEQTPAPIVFLSAADTEIQTLSRAVTLLPQGFPAIRAANLLQLQQQLTIDTYGETVLGAAQVVVVRLLGGQSYWSYGVEVLQTIAADRVPTPGRTSGLKLIFLPGDDRPDPDLISRSTVPLAIANRLWRYCCEGGVENFYQGLLFLGQQYFGRSERPAAPQPVANVGRYRWVGLAAVDGAADEAVDGAADRDEAVGVAAADERRFFPTRESGMRSGVGILFYRAHYLSGNTAPVDALCEALCEALGETLGEALGDRQLNPVPLYVSSLRDLEVQRAVLQAFAAAKIQVLINMTGFAIHTEKTIATPSHPSQNNFWQQLDVPVIQAICSGGTKAAWESSGQGLSPQDMAMNVVLPEMDGRIITRAISFKGVQRRDAALETEVVTYEPVGDRIEFVAELAARWVDLRQSAVGDRRIALILANYPTRDGRLANGVGLDTPESCVQILNALHNQGYQLSRLPKSGQELIEWLTASSTNDPDGRGLRPVSQGLALADYQAYFERLPSAVREGIQNRWGEPALDPEAPDQLQFPVAGLDLGHVFVGIQPPRGYDQDPSLNYHAPDLEPPHAYLAFYEWLRSRFRAQAMVHVGKHGNLEWLPGKSIALSEACYPEVALGPWPHLYPFIVNDPGEGSQAKRRAQAVIIDHLTPPLTRAELYGPLMEIESLVDEYYDAQRLDPSRLPVIRDRLLELIHAADLQTDLQSNLQADAQLKGAADQPHDRKPELEASPAFSLAPSSAPSPTSPTQNPKNQQKTLRPNSLETVTKFEAASPEAASPEAASPEAASPKPNRSEAPEFETAVLSPLDTYLCELKEAQIRDGLHILGQCPEGRQLRDLAIAIARMPSDGRLGLTRAIAQDLGLDWDPLTVNLGEALSRGDRDRLEQFNSHQPERHWRTLGDAVEWFEQQAAVWIDPLIDPLIDSVEGDPSELGGANRNPDETDLSQKPPTASALLPAKPIYPGTQTQLELDWIAQTLLPQLRQTPAEISNLLRGLDGRYVPSGPSGAPSRGRSDVLPTGRNFYSVDIRGLPTESAWAVGDRAASAVIERYTQDQGEYPQTLGLSIWGTATMRTGGDDMAEALALLGVRPVWEGPSRRVVDFEILPLSLLGRPRVDVTLRISGFFRDAFANLIDLFDQAVVAIAELDEPADQNPLAARARAEAESWRAQGIPPDQAQARSRFRIFGSKPGAYGAGLQGLIEAQNWESDRDLARAYINWSSYAYGRTAATGQAAPEAFQQRLQNLQIVLHNQDNREHDLLDSDDYYQFQGGLTAAVRLASGLEPQVYFGDHSRPENPKVRPLSAEIARVYRSRVVNPKWIAGVMRHGYKGAFEMAATVDYLFAYDATTHCVPDHMYAGVAEAYVLNPKAQAFVQTHNPWALRDMAERLLEANQRGLWKGESGLLAELRAIALQAEEKIETRNGSI